MEYCIVPDKRGIHTVLFVPLPFEKWWKGHIVLPVSVHPFPSAFGISNLHFKFFRQWHLCPLDKFLVLRVFLHENICCGY